ncbi:MAG TPA: response regulator [Bacteroidota bacterium]|nr:response regulator [Bacteroidota bacterium]
MKKPKTPVPRVLVVDDEKMFRTVTVQACKEEGFQVAEASSGKEAIDRCRERSFDIVLLDVRMNDLDGLETLKILREQSPSTEYLIVTGHAEVGLALQALKSGIREFITKPIGTEELVQRIKSVWRARLAEKRLKEMQIKFNTQIFNDLLTQLGSVRTALQSINGNGKSGESQKGLLANVSETLGTMEARLNNMIDMTMYEADGVEIERIPTNLDELVPAVCAQFKSRCNARKIKMTVNVAPGISTIEMDPIKIERVLKHLIENAMAHTPKQGSIDVRVSPVSMPSDGNSKEFVEVAITDSGAPIPRSELLLAFDKYKDVLTEKTPSASADALRLPICKSIIEAHRGTISANSEEGKGSTFAFSIPVQ